MNIIIACHEKSPLFSNNHNLLNSCSPLCVCPNQLISGTWEGSLAVSGIQLRIVFHVESDQGGELNAKMDSPDQGAFDIACGEVTLEGEKVIIQVPQVGGKYEGDFVSPDEIEGTWSQGQSNIPLDLRYTEEVEIPNRPQEPKPPFPYASKEVNFQNKTEGITLSGTLTLPVGGGPFPVAVMVSGSGPQDRDESVFGHKPFLVISDYLTRHGIAVLRYDDRGVGSSTGNFAEATSEDFATDARAAIDYLKTLDQVDPERIGIIGHSEGGLIAPMVASGSKDLGFIVMLAGPGIKGTEILLLQSRLIAEAAGTAKEEIERNERLLKKVYSLLYEQEDDTRSGEKLESLVDEYIADLPEDEKEEPENSKGSIMQRLNGLTSPWFRFFMTYDPKPVLQKVTCPVLALNGEKDLQVPPKENLTAIEEALKTGGNRNYLVKELEGLNHLFQHSETGAPTEYGNIEETFSEDALKIIADWINKLD